jgi:hypothetical protein
VERRELWRVALVYVGLFGVQLIVRAWLIHYLTQDGGMAVALAGLLAFVMFAVSATARDLGGTLSARRVSPVFIVGETPRADHAAAARRERRPDDRDSDRRSGPCRGER